MKTHHETRNRAMLEYWYDRAIRCWTVTRVDVNGYQIGDAQYCANRVGLESAKDSAASQGA
jgi:hypothetical protein